MLNSLVRLLEKNIQSWRNVVVLYTKAEKMLKLQRIADMVDELCNVASNAAY